MNDRAPSKQALLQRQRATRVQEKTLPDQVRTAYGQVPIELSDLASDDPQLAQIRESARASFVKHDRLTEEELNTLPVDEAVAVAVQRLRDQAASLKQQADSLATEDRASANASHKPPRTVRR